MGIGTIGPITDAQRMVDIFEVSTPAVQKAMTKAFMPVVSVEGFPENAFEMRDSRTGKLLSRVVNIEEGEKLCTQK